MTGISNLVEILFRYVTGKGEFAATEQRQYAELVSSGGETAAGHGKSSLSEIVPGIGTIN